MRDARKRASGLGGVAEISYQLPVARLDGWYGAPGSVLILGSWPLVSGKKILLFDPEGGRMFIEMGIPGKSTPKVVVCV